MVVTVITQPFINSAAVIDLDTAVSDSSFDEALFRKIIKEKCNAFSDKADKIISEAKKAGVSPVIFASIMIHESAWGTSFAIKQHNNPSGQMSAGGLIHYNSLDEGIEATGRTLKNLIVERKLQTVEALGSVYCPVGAANDPMGLNKNWVPAIKEFIMTLGGNPEASLLWASSGSSGGNINASGKAKIMLEWANSMHKKGVQYTMSGLRGTFPYFDCSAFVTRAMEQAGVPIGLGSTETLYAAEGTYLEPITKEQVKAGDIFVWGTKGGSGGEYGHTGFFIDNGQNIIHCTPATQNGFSQEGDVVKTPFEGYYGDSSLAPVYFYRVK